MPDFPFQYVLLGTLAIALLVAAFTDIRRRQIDNWLTLSIALAAPLFWWASGADWAAIGWQMLTAAIAFGVLAGLFALGQMGGGDVKLLSALALWIKPLLFVRLVLAMAIIGGVLTLFIGMTHVMRRKKGRLMIPYGVAIATAGLWILATQYLPAMQAAVAAGKAG